MNKNFSLIAVLSFSILNACDFNFSLISNPNKLANNIDSKVANIKNYRENKQKHIGNSAAELVALSSNLDNTKSDVYDYAADKTNVTNLTSNHATPLENDLVANGLIIKNSTQTANAIHTDTSVLVGDRIVLDKVNKHKSSEKNVPVKPDSSIPQGYVLMPDFVHLVETESQKVVNVRTIGKAEQVVIGPDDSNLYDFFKRFGVPTPPVPNGSRGSAPQNLGTGSGFIATEDGYILTNAHVVAEADEIIVKLYNTKEFPAKLVGLDKKTDIAVLKIEAKNLPVVRFGNIDELKVGEPVAAIGSPFGFDNSITSGIVSAKSRSLPDGTFVPFIQTDVAVNPGNSGGPLFNLSGEVVGINSQIYTRSGGYMGVSFSIPIDIVLKVKDELIKFGVVRRGRLGVGIQSISDDMADVLGLKSKEGAIVSSIAKDGPAAMAKIEVGDIIFSVNEIRVNSSIDLTRIIGGLKPNDKVRVQLARKNKEMLKEIKLGTLDEAEVEVVKKPKLNKTDKSSPNQKMGLELRESLDKEKPLDEKVNGVTVVDMDYSKFKGDLLVGDVILYVNSAPVNKVSDFYKLVSDNKNKAPLLIYRKDSKIFVPFKSLPQKE